MTKPELLVDKTRAVLSQTGIYVRAQMNGVHGSYDIAVLDKASLLSWLHSEPDLAENTLLAMLGHDE